MSKKLQKVNRAFMHQSIPYKCCFEEDGMIEKEAGLYTICFRVLPPKETVKGSYNAKMTRMHMEEMLQKLLDQFSFEFTIHNYRIDMEKYLAEVSLADTKDDCMADYTAYRKLYNKMLEDNCEIGHNNFAREVFLTVSVEADTPDKALQMFDDSMEWIRECFSKIYGFQVHLMSLTEQMEGLYGVYHPEDDAAPFGSRVDYDGKGFSIKSMQRMKLDTKDVVAPDYYECRERDYMRIGSYYVRTFFINSIPDNVPDSVLLDLASVSSNSMVSVHYERVDEDLGFRLTAKRVKDNTEVKNIPITNTVLDRKEHRMQRQEKNIRDEEEEYFYHSALDLFKNAKAKNQTTVQAAFIITLFAQSLEELDRDSSLLYVSASKYVCQIRCLDLQQNEGFQSVLPLNNLKVNVSRVFSVSQMAAIQPLNIQEIFENVRTFYGLNAINDNFVFIDRANFPTAMISGNDHTGKTMSVKREATNTLLSTRDDVVILARNPKEYKGFAEKMFGTVWDEFCPDIFSKSVNYNLNADKRDLQKIFFEAYLTAKVGFHRDRITPEALAGYYQRASQEADVLSEFSDWNEALQYAREHPVEMQLFSKSLEQFRMGMDSLSGNHRLTIMGFENEAELLVNFDYLWNYAVECKKKNRSVWIFVDGADDLLYSVSGSDYLVSILERAEMLRVPITLVIQDAVHIVTNQNAVIEFDYLLNKIRYFKLLSMGPIERRKFVERLNISQQLIPYFVDRGPGEGILITPSANIAVNDRFEAEDNEFYRLFTNV